jgi:hypothetical protein
MRQQIDILEKMGKFLNPENSPRLNHEESFKISKMSKEIESVLRSLPFARKKEEPGPHGFTA